MAQLKFRVIKDTYLRCTGKADFSLYYYIIIYAVKWLKKNHKDFDISKLKTKINGILDGSI